MFEGAFPSPDTNPTPTTAGEPPIVWLEHGEGVAPGAVIQPAPERDPEAVIEFLLKKVEEHEARMAEREAVAAAAEAKVAEQAALIAEQQQKIADQASLAELLNTEIDQLRGQLEVTREELDRQLADYEVVMQNALATERELENHKQRSVEKPKISLPFHTEQKLAKLGWTDADPAIEAEAV